MKRILRKSWSCQDDVREKVRARPLEASNNPWADFIGMFEGDEDFAELAAELRKERDLDTSNNAVSYTITNK